MKITFISDTHNNHKKVTNDLPGGDLIIHAGDISSMGFDYEIEDFCKWYNDLDNYTYKIFIGGNHDWGFQIRSELTREIVKKYPNIIYLEDEEFILENGTKVYGSPWQPTFYNWAFNLPRNSQELEDVWKKIPNNTDILITHGPPYDILDRVPYSGEQVGCEKLLARIHKVKPKLHVFGHIHPGYGYQFNKGIHCINASVLNDRYQYSNKPINLEWDKKNNQVEFK